MRVSYNTIAIFAFWCFQPFILYVFLEYGRDTAMYIDMAKGVGSQYLEPFWILLYGAFDVITPNSWVKFYSMYLLFLFGCYWFVREALNFSLGWLAKISILMLVWSVQLSAVGGAFRQGIALIFFSLFLVSPAVRYHLISMLTHWSGVLYFLFWKRGAYIFAILLCAAIAVIIGVSLGFFQSNISIFGRLAFYLSNPFETDLGVTYGVVINKGLVFILFLMNCKVLKYSEAGSKPVLFYTFMLVPVIQIAVFVVTGSQQILHRFGMILDPFVIVFFVLIACRGALLSRLVVFLLILVKLLSRMIIVFEV